MPWGWPRRAARLARVSQWKNPLRSLPTRIAFVVLSATLVSSLAVTAFSANSIDSFLRSKIDQKFPRILVSVSEKIDLWYDQRVLELGVFSSSTILVENLDQLGPEGSGGRARSEVQQYLAYVLDSFPQYGALFVLDPNGETLIWVGDRIPLTKPLRTHVSAATRATVSDIAQIVGERVQIASALVEDSRGRPLGTLNARLRLEPLDEILQSQDLGRSGEIFVVGASGQYLSSATGRSVGDLFGRELPSSGAPTAVRDYTNDTGERVVGSALSFSRFGWTLVVEESYGDAFAPVVTAIRRVVGVNLAIVVAIGLVAFRIAASIVKPIEALSNAVRRISEGDRDVVIPDSQARDEVGLLVRAFNEMTVRLATNAAELESSRQEIEEANERLRVRNQELHQVNEVLEQLSITDGLTKLHNHRYFQDNLAREAKRADRTAEPLALILIDIDHFKNWNDKLGHAGGDQILRKLADVMNELIRETDLLARYGGEEFALLTPNTDLEGAMSLAEKIRERVASATFFLSPPTDREPVTVSIGVAMYGGNHADLFNDADRALYRAKDAGRDCVMAAEEQG